VIIASFVKGRYKVIGPTAEDSVHLRLTGTDALAKRAGNKLKKDESLLMNFARRGFAVMQKNQN
jgi:hypothetical protein